MDLEEVSKKKKRSRHKKLFKQIKEQMEFYFGDSNLLKDRFLSKEMNKSEEKWVDLEIFSRFNKIKCLTEDMSLVAKSLSSSDLLEVSSDGKRVRRTKPIKDRKDVDDRTVYVECLPHTADHQWVKNLFIPFGKVLYVSLPKYQSTGDIKGFAFVEFNTKEEAERACEDMNNPPVSASDSAGMFPKTNKQMIQLEKKTGKKIHLDQLKAMQAGGRTRSVSESAVETPIVRGANKRWRTTSECSDGEEREDLDLIAAKRARKDIGDDKDSGTTENKKRKADSDSDSDSDDEPSPKKKMDKVDSTENKGAIDKKSSGIDKKLESSLKKRKQGEDGNEVETKKVRINETVEEVAAKEEKKKRNRKKKKKDKDKSVPELRVMSKKDWLKLRTEYLNLQKSSMKELKKSIKNIKVQDNQKENEGNEMDVDKKAKKDTTPVYSPGCIVKAVSIKPMERKKLKEDLSTSGDISYIDIQDGDLEAHVRCPTCQNAESIAKATLEGVQLSVLTGDDDKQYWDKLLADREKRLNSKTKKKKTRGREKTFNQVEKINTDINKKKHIVFDDN